MGSEAPTYLTRGACRHPGVQAGASPLTVVNAKFNNNKKKNMNIIIVVVVLVVVVVVVAVTLNTGMSIKIITVIVIRNIFMSSFIITLLFVFVRVSFYCQCYYWDHFYINCPLYR